MVVVIDTCTAKSSVSDVLLHVGVSPSSEGGEVAERGILIVVGIPKGVGIQSAAGMLRAHDRVPHAQRSIHSRGFAVGVNSVSDLSDEFAVASSCVSTPGASRARVGLNINPNSGVKTGSNMLEEFIDLGSSALSSAGEHVHISGEASRVSILEILDCMSVNSSKRAVGPGYDKRDSIVLKAGEGGGREGL